MELSLECDCLVMMTVLLEGIQSAAAALGNTMLQSHKFNLPNSQQRQSRHFLRSPAAEWETSELANERLQTTRNL